MLSSFSENGHLQQKLWTLFVVVYFIFTSRGCFEFSWFGLWSSSFPIRRMSFFVLFCFVLLLLYFFYL